jgi:hypothetical protein
MKLVSQLAIEAYEQIQTDESIVVELTGRRAVT